MPYARVSTFQYKPGSMKEVVRKAEQELLPMLQKELGFVCYELVTEQDRALALTSWETREQADAWMKKVGRWVDEKLGALRVSGDAWLGELRLEAEAPSTGAALVEAMYAAFNAREFDRMLSFATPDAKILNVNTGEELSLKDDIQNWATAFKDGKIETTRVLQSGNHIVSEYIGRGTHTGPLKTPMGTIPPTNQRVELQFVEVAELRDGKVAKVRAYFDTGSLMLQLGLAPEPMMPAGMKGAPARPEARH